MVGDTAPKRWRIAVDALAVITFCALALSAFTLYARFSDTNHARARNAEIWHAVVCDIEKQVVASPDLTQARKVTILTFYDRLLVQDAHAAACGLTIHLGR